MLGKNGVNKILVIVCLASLILNIWLIGFVLGNKADEYRHGHEGEGGRFERRVQMLTKDLPPDAQKRFMDNMKDYLPEDESEFRNKLEGLNYKLAESIKGENVDVETAQETLAEIRSSFSQIHMKLHQGFLKAVQELSPEDRNTIAEALEKKKY
ncbi:MAG TPA: periplasmic heavy metal sensor [Thermodesulfobacteriota bacterium]|nr:periplasmic heavy metal sensor [Thermodesulfobacteriota bacterium]